jgi:hypothetical protein
MMIVLARVRQFLPQIEQSNAELLQRDPRSIDIEHIEETDECIIQMASEPNCPFATMFTQNDEKY